MWKTDVLTFFLLWEGNLTFSLQILLAKFLISTEESFPLNSQLECQIVMIRILLTTVLIVGITHGTYSK